jgi:hypothetical protein
VDFASATQALVKVRVRVVTIVYVDYLSYHFLEGDWLISAKAFHVEKRFCRSLSILRSMLRSE